MPTIANTTLPSSNPNLVIDGFASGMPRLFVAATTAVSSAIIATGFWTGVGAGGRSGYQAGVQVGDLMMHTQVTTAGVPVKATLHVCIASTADQASTSASTGWNTAYNATFATAT